MRIDEDKDYKLEWRKAMDELVNLRQEYMELNEDKDYIKSLLDAEFKKGLNLKKENDNCKNDYRELFSNYIALEEKNEQLRQELQGMDELLQSYRKTIRHNVKLLADASKNGYLPPLDDYVSKDDWVCGCCKHFHSGVRDRCDKDNNWVLKNESCQDFER